MRSFSAKVFVIISFLVTVSFAQKNVTVIEDSIFASSIDSYTRFKVVLPIDYNKSSERYTTIYLLHGFGGSYQDWVSRTGLVRYLRKYKFIVVTPDAQNSWYTNFISDKKYKYEDFIVKDLIPAIDKKYRTLSTRHGRVIAGLSMGGYGSIKYALKYPNMFFYAGSFSGAFRIPTTLEKYYQQNPSGVFRESLISAFGLNKGAHWDNNDCLVLVDSLKEKNVPYLYLSCGKDDNATGLLDFNRLLVDKINKKGLLYEYHESPGVHNWLFWDKEIKVFLEKVASFTPFQ